VGFVSYDDYLKESEPGDVYDIWLFDTAALTNTLVTSATDGSRQSCYPSLSDDGTVVAFYSDSDLLGEGRPRFAYEVWLYDTAALTYTRVTSASAGGRDSDDPCLSADGTVIAFVSDSDFLNEGRPNDVNEIWLYDTKTLTFTRATSA
jgi:Tol biopolymer transport system component